MDPIALAEAGPVAILLAGIGFLALGFVKGWVVPGWIYSAAIDRAERAETQAQRTTEALLKATTVVDKSIDARTAGTGASDA